MDDWNKADGNQKKDAIHTQQEKGGGEEDEKEALY